MVVLFVNFVRLVFVALALTLQTFTLKNLVIVIGLQARNCALRLSEESLELLDCFLVDLQVCLQLHVVRDCHRPPPCDKHARHKRLL